MAMTAISSSLSLRKLETTGYFKIKLSVVIQLHAFCQVIHNFYYYNKTSSYNDECELGDVFSVLTDESSYCQQLSFAGSVVF